MYTRNEKIIPVYIEEEMKDSYINYAMSVIVGRALPDVRDGLKPVHRRILFTMKELNLEHNKPYKKSARIVGDCLGKFHPHGDAAVYDTLVRMAQEFSLRYTLVDGQGNFGCFTKDIKVRLTDGRSLSFEELIRESKEGKKNYTFTINHETQKIEIAEIKNPRKTRAKAELVKVILDNGEEIRCTPNHRFMLRDATYKIAKDLKPSDSLMPLYTKLDDGGGDRNLKGYEVIYQPVQKSWEFVHRLADQWNQHWVLHKEVASWRHKNDPEYVKKLAEGRKKYLSESSNLKKISLRLRERNLKNWKDISYRKRMGEIIHQAWQRPEYRQKITKSSSKNLKRLWEKKEFQDLLSSLKSKELKKRWKDVNYRNFIAEVTRKMSLKIWSDPKHREHISRLNKERCQDPTYRQKMSERSKALWKNPEFRSKYSPEHFKKMAKTLWGNPVAKKMYSEKAKKQWLDIDFRTKMVDSITKSNHKRIKDNPYMMPDLTNKAKASLKQKWADPSHKEKVIRSKILGYVSKLIEENKTGLTTELYEKNKPLWVPKTKKVLEYFGSLKSLEEQARHHNHKVIRVEELKKIEDVFDLTIYPWHNFALASGVFVHNSVDGDAAASMRYTEARMEHITDWMLLDIDRDTVDFMPNFDGSLKEPTVLPACLPNLLVNGSSGIAVGMATNIPPHNLKEVAEAVTFVIDNADCEPKDLIKIVKGPDFPTGGIIRGMDGIKNAYTTGRGIVRVHAKAFIEEGKNGKEAIIIKEIPYMVNKANLIESIAELVQNKKIEGISDLRDESDKDGIRVVIELKRGTIAKVILNQLYKHTQMQETFGVIMLALVNGRPKILNLKEVIDEFIKHRKEIVTRRTKFELDKAQDRAHILEGLKIALKYLDRIIKVIRESKDPAVAKVELIKKFELSDRQAQAILEMQLQRLTHLERDKLEKEYLELIKRIEFLKSILASEKKILEIIKEEMKELSEKFGDARRTDIMPEAEELEIEDLIAEEDVVITISHAGYIKRLPVSAYRKQRRGGKGVTGAEMREEDFIEHLFIASTHEYLLFFTDKGKVHWVKVHEIPEAGRLSKGKAIVNLLALPQGDKISAFVPVRKFEEGKFLMMATRNGNVKKTSLTAYSNARKAGIIGIGLEKGDELIEVVLTSSDQEVLIATKEGKAIRFRESDIRDMGRGAKGVRGIRLGKKDSCIAMAVAKPDQTVLTVTQSGFGKRTSFKEYRLTSRGGKGVINIKMTGKNGEAAGMKTVSDKDEIMLITEKGMIVRSPVKDIRATGRSTQGVRLMKLDSSDKIASVAKIVTEDEQEEKPGEAITEIPSKSSAIESEEETPVSREVKKEAAGPMAEERPKSRPASKGKKK